MAKRLVLLIIAAFILFYGFNVYKQSKIDDYNRSALKIINKANKKLARQSSYLLSFPTVPKEAKKLAPRFKKASDITAQAASDLEKITPPSRYLTKHQKLIKDYTDGSKLYDDLNGLAVYLVKRDKVLKGLVKNLQSFAGSVSKAKSSKEAIRIAKQAEKAIKHDLESIKDLKSPIGVYNDKVLLKYGNSLTKHIADFHKTLLQNDSYKIQMALYYIQLDYANNWQKAFLLADKNALKVYEEKVKSLQT